jgi:hypothetical protein
VLVPPLEDLVGVDSVLPRYAGYRCTGNERCFNDPPLLLRRAMNTLRPTAPRPAFNRIAHNEIVGHTDAHVHTARPGRLRAVDTRLVSKYDIFIFEVLKAWTDPAQKNPKTIHHHGYGRFAVDGEMIRLKSKKA